ncbi:Serine carboxypeptidase-like 51 [Cardamine amara subsp. amara]|uniref:Carboxypeptidase n=1 Tax=Cardamine amara subsp. amara TaxID=228776 RepID=A0ABD0Z8M9_CARAN
MKRSVIAYLLILCLLVSCNNGGAKTVRSYSDGSEAWGYVEVRPKAHMFWWHYKSPYRVEDPSKPWPIILWLQGGPGASGVGIGNFQEVGPLDTFLKPRNSTWLKKADLLFVDSPVGSGYSFVEENQKDLYVKSDEEAAKDLTKLLQQLFNKNHTLNQSPLFIVAESYGGKIAVKLGLSVFDSVQSGKLKLHLGGVVLGDSWISPEDFVLSWGPLLNYVSRLDDKGLDLSNSLAEKIRKQIKNDEYVQATQTWIELENVISSKSNSVDFYNFLLDSEMDPVSLTTSEIKKENIIIKKYSRYLNDLRSSSDVDEGDLDTLMNGVIKKKLKIIPKDLRWGNNSGDVFTAMEGDFMRPTIEGVDELLAKGIDVTIYNGQLDVICSTSGTEAWVRKLKWEGIEEYKKIEREPLYCENDKATRGFTKSYKNLHFYWILGAGHFVPVDEPCVALKMVGEITKSPQL